MDLEDLDLCDAGLMALTRLPNLWQLDLRGSVVTESGAAWLATALPDCEIVR